MGLDGAEQRALGGDAHWIGRDGAISDAELAQMADPAGGISEVPVRMSGEAGDHWSRQGALAHVSERFLVDHIVEVTGAQQFEEVQPALGAGRAEPSSRDYPNTVSRVGQT